LKPYVVILTAAAESDLFAIYNYIALRASPTIALRFVERIEKYCLGFGDVPESGTRRDELRPGLRTAGFRRRATILFEVAMPREKSSFTASIMPDATSTCQKITDANWQP
jgi:toxin ParE1/3/4